MPQRFDTTDPIDYWGIISASGNMLEWFDNERDARAAYDAMAAECAGGGGWVGLIGFNKSGLAVETERSEDAA